MQQTIETPTPATRTAAIRRSALTPDSKTLPELFGVQFYPTPKTLIDKMLEGINVAEVGAILEPSAGKGDIIEAIVRRRDRSQWGHRRYWDAQEAEVADWSGYDIDAIEVDPALQAILQSHKVRVVHDDFESYETWKRYGLVVMNPPFALGCRHLLKAIRMQEGNSGGGKIVCVLNAETIKNPYTIERQDLKRRLKELGASIEYLAESFDTDETQRKTKVAVALVKIDFPARSAESVILEGLRSAKASDAAKAERSEQARARHREQITPSDYISTLIQRYRFEVEVGISLMNEYESLRVHMLDKIGSEYVKPILKLEIDASNKSCYGDASTRHNLYIEMLRSKYWTALLADRRFTGILTSENQTRYLNEVERLKDYEFSEYNIATLRIEFAKMALAGIDEAIVKLFDELSHKYEYRDDTSQNIHYYNGWKTNKAWRINKKVIVPMYGVLQNDYNGGLRLGYGSRACQFLSDVEKVMMYLDGKPFADSPIASTLERAVGRGQTRGIECGYFRVTFYKKGTCHIEFNDERLLHKFNIYGSQKKFWLPPTYGRVKYQDMGAEERAVVDDFEGQKSYEKTLAEANFYIVAANPGRLLESVNVAGGGAGESGTQQPALAL